LAETAFDQTGKSISCSALHVAAAGVDDEADHAARAQRGRQQFPEHAVGVVGGAADHQHVAFLALLDRDMDHPVVAGLRQHGNGRAADRGAGINRPQIRLHQAGTAERLVRGGDAAGGERPDGVGISALDVADNDGFHDFLRTQPSVSVTRGNNV
jgi:hypothetical protein